MSAAAEQAGVSQAFPKQHGALGGAAWTALTAAILVALAIVLAMTVRSAFLFASVGPIILELIERPLARASSPRSTLVANALALVTGYAFLAIFGLRHHGSTLEEGVTVARALAVICTLGVTGALLVLLRAVHPPGGATALLVVLGIIKEPVELACMFATVVVITVVAWILNRLAGLDVPLWSSPSPAPYDAEPGRKVST